MPAGGGAGVVFDDGTLAVQSRQWSIGGGLSIAYDAEGRPQLTSSGGSSHALTDHTDVTISSPATGHVLRYNGSTWVNAALTAADVPSHDIVSKHTASGLTTGHFLKATSATTFAFQAHGLSYGDVGAAAASHSHDASAITSGIFALARGGTGVTMSGLSNDSQDLIVGAPDGTTLTFVDHPKANQLLQATSGGGWTFTTAGTIGGSVSTNYVPYASSADTLADSHIQRGSNYMGVDSNFYVYGPGAGVSTYLYIYGYAGTPVLRTYHAQGTKASPTATQYGDWMGTYIFAGHDGTTYSNAGGMIMIAAENWDATHHGTYLRFLTRASGAGDYQVQWEISSTGILYPFTEGKDIGSTSKGIGALHFYDTTADRVLMRSGSAEIMRMEYGGAAGQQGLAFGSNQNSTAIFSGEGAWTYTLANVEIGQDETLRLYSDAYVEIATLLQTAWADRQTWQFTSHNPGRLHFPYSGGAVTSNYLYASSNASLWWTGTFRASTLDAGDIKAGVLTYAYGGTGQSSWTKGDLMYASADNVLSKLGVSGVTDGYVLTYVDALGLPQWAAPPAGVGGSGSDNYFPLWNGTNSLDNSTMFMSGTTWYQDGNAVIRGPAASSGGVDSVFAIYAWTDTGTGFPHLDFYQANGDVGTPTATLSGDVLANIRFIGRDNSAYSEGARIQAVAQQNWGASEHSTELRFYVRETGALFEAWRIYDTGAWLPIGTRDIGGPSNRVNVFYVNEINADVGSPGDPSYMFNGYPTTGLYHSSGVAIAVSGVHVATFGSGKLYPGVDAYDLGDATYRWDAHLKDVVHYGQTYCDSWFFPSSSPDHQDVTGTLDIDWRNKIMQAVSMGNGSLNIDIDDPSNSYMYHGAYHLVVFGSGTQGDETLTITGVDLWIGTNYGSGVTLAQDEMASFTFVKYRNRANDADLVIGITLADAVTAPT